MTFGLIRSALVAAAAVAISTPALAQVTGDCTAPNKVKYISSTQDNLTTTSMSFVGLPDTTVKFTQSVQGCVIITLTLGKTANSLTDDLRVRAVIADVGTGYPNEVTLLSYNGATVQFLLKDVPPGARTAKIQFRTASGSDVFVSRPMTTVTYR